MKLNKLKHIQLSEEDFNNLSELLKYLESLDTSSYINSAYGICELAYYNCNVPWCKLTNKGITHHIFKCWPKYTGSDSYPVPHPSYVGQYDEIRACEAFERFDKWDGDYGKLRRELLEHMIGCIKYLLEVNNENYL